MKRLQMYFKNEDNDRKSLSIANMKDDLTAENVTAASNEIIQARRIHSQRKAFQNAHKSRNNRNYKDSTCRSTKLNLKLAVSSDLRDTASFIFVF